MFSLREYYTAYFAFQILIVKNFATSIKYWQQYGGIFERNDTSCKDNKIYFWLYWRYPIIKIWEYMSASTYHLPT